jgi:Uncharacterized conserved protein
MKLHENAKLFSDTITETAMFLNVEEIFIEKDYWLTYALQRMSQNPNTDKVVFKGGTSLSKGYRITNRFSEDIDIAVIDADSMTGNQLKMLIKRLAKDMSVGLEEKVIPKVTSKGSRFYKAIYSYPSIIAKMAKTAVKSGELLIEINTYGNPYPYVKQEITSFITEYFKTENHTDLLEQYGLQPFILNILDKRRTMLEKVVSLLRFSFDENPKTELSKKIRHFYDLHYLANNTECAAYIQTIEFIQDLQELFTHDQTEFDIPKGWTDKAISDSPLLTEFAEFWSSLKTTYKDELSNLAFIEIPDEKHIENIFFKLIERIKKGFI